MFRVRSGGQLFCSRAGWSACDDGGEFFFFQAEDGIRDLVRSRGLGDVYKRQLQGRVRFAALRPTARQRGAGATAAMGQHRHEEPGLQRRNLRR